MPTILDELAKVSDKILELKNDLWEEEKYDRKRLVHWIDRSNARDALLKRCASLLRGSTVITVINLVMDIDELVKKDR